MYLLPCPQCQTTATISPSQAGDEITCSSCDASISIPKLGDLRKLPRSEESQETPESENENGFKITVVALGLLAVISLFATGFTAIRWYLIESDMSTQEHIAQVRSDFAGKPMQRA